MIRSRLRPLLALFALLGAVLVARLYQVQVWENDVWAREAARLVYEREETPYRRGRILDAHGTVLARDVDVRSVELVYREFRREHPLGQVAHARSLLEGRPVPLSEARAHLVEWARALVALSPADLRAFARGTGAAPGLLGLDQTQRTRRAADLLFYLRGLLDLDSDDSKAQWKALLNVLRDGDQDTRSFLELCADVRARFGQRGAKGDAAAEGRALEQRLTRSLKWLELLARRLQLQPESDGAGSGPTDAPAALAPSGDPLGPLVDELERARRSVEDLTAAKLFSEATGFAPGRLEADTLLECFDHAWLVALLGWDEARLAEWAQRVRAGWLKNWRDGECLPQLFWQLAGEPARVPGPEDFLDRLALPWEPEGALRDAFVRGPRPWREVGALAVCADLDSALEAGVPAAAHALGAAALPFQLEEMRADPDPARLLPEGEGVGSFRGLLEKSLGGHQRADIEVTLALAAELGGMWELRFQETLRRALDEIRHAAPAAARGPRGGLVLAREGRERASERAEYFLRDFGTRPRRLDTKELTYDVVYLLARYESDFPGFRVHEGRARELVRVTTGEDEHPAEGLIGTVTAPTLDDLVRQREAAVRLSELKARPQREEEEEDEMRRLAGEVRLPDEARGVSGIEAYFEPELAGQNGFKETRGRGLADLVAGSEDLHALAPVDGRDVMLTLDAGLQAALQRSLRKPDRDDEGDADWTQNPVGAIVLLDAQGDVLAAASEPDDQFVPGPAAQGERLVVAERTLTKRRFQPPGSCFKPYVAAWALDHGLDPERTVTCGPIAGGGCGYKTLRCWNHDGHGPVNLQQALERSCNAYFAWLGETLSTRDFEELCAIFGFGEPTGVRPRELVFADGTREDASRRFGLREDRAGLAVPARGELSDSNRSMAANGLGVIEATPMQVARGILGLATGEKFELRLVQKIGARELAPAAHTPLPISQKSLDFVRAALRGVAADEHGTGHNALALDKLGLPVAVKTGSADLQRRKDGEGKSIVNKHTWVAGWLPAQDPKLVFVVFEHGTVATSSRGAVFLARQVLQQPEVVAWLAAHGVDVSGVEAARVHR